MATTTSTDTTNMTDVQQRGEPRNPAPDHATLNPEQARQATRGNGVWIILTVSTGLAITVLLILFGNALG